MKDELISYSTAVLAKKKGFDIQCHNFYGRVFPHFDFAHLHHDLENFPGDFSSFAPAQSLLQRWLRETQSLILLVEWDSVTYGYTLNNLKKPDSEWETKGWDMWDSYEEALEHGLVHALNQIVSPTNAEATI